MAGYGVNTDWIQEYESLIGRKLKEFTIADSSMIHFFEVRQRNNIRYSHFSKWNPHPHSGIRAELGFVVPRDKPGFDVGGIGLSL